MLEIFKIKEPKIIKALMILDLTKNRTLKIGRGDGSDIKFKHHSISREHCLFKMNNDFRIVDLQSKYGSFVIIDKKDL